MDDHSRAYAPKAAAQTKSIGFTPEPPVQAKAVDAPAKMPELNPDASVFNTDLNNPYANLFGSAAPPSIQAQAEPPPLPEFNPDASIFNTDLNNPYAGLFGSLGPTTASTPIQPKLTVGAVGDKYEQEADTVAAQVVKTINNPQPSASVQREGGEEEELQMKPLNTIQREGEEEEELQMKPERGAVQRRPVRSQISDLQMKPLNIQRRPAGRPNLLLQMHNHRVQRQVGAQGGAVSGNLESSIQSAKGGGQPMGDSVREPMEQAFGADFSNVKIHTDSNADTLNRSLSSRAFTTGPDLFFKKGEYSPGSTGGQELLAHELTHVVQQGGAGIQKKSASQEAVKIRRNVVPGIQRLITKDDLYDVRVPPNDQSADDIRYNQLLDGVEEYHQKTAKEKFGVSDTISEDADDEEFNSNSPEIFTKLKKIHKFAESGTEDHPVYGLLQGDIEQEQNALNNIYIDTQSHKGQTLYEVLQSAGGNPSNSESYKKFIDIMGADVADTKSPSNDASKAPKKAKAPDSSSWMSKIKNGFTNPTAGGNSKRLLLEGTGHLIASTLLLGLGISMCATGVGAVAGGPGLAIAGAGQAIIGFMKFGRAYLAAKIKKMDKKKDKTAEDEAQKKKWQKISAALIIAEGFVAATALTLASVLSPLPMAGIKIAQTAVSGTGSVVKMARGGLTALKDAKNQSKGYKLLLNVMQLGEITFGLISGVLGQIGMVLKLLAEGAGNVTAIIIKAGKTLVSGLVTGVKGQRNIAGLKKIVGAEANAAEAAK